MPIDHLGIHTTPELHEATVAFYTAALQPLGYQKMVDMFDGKLVALGSSTPDFWIAMIGVGTTEKKLSNAHYAFAANDQKTVDEFHAKGLEAGGKDNGKPGPRDHYHPGYYGGYLLDPVGNSAEVVYHGQPPK